jgi:hypothetical protein
VKLWRFSSIPRCLPFNGARPNERSRPSSTGIRAATVFKKYAFVLVMLLHLRQLYPHLRTHPKAPISALGKDGCSLWSS